MIGVSLACFLWASSYYKVPTSLLLSIAQVEGGRVGTISMNTNGTADLGPMQINTIWINDIARSTGQPTRMVQYRLINDGCYNVGIGAWILQKNILRTGNAWVGAAHYHSRTPALARSYLTKVYNKHQVVVRQLQALYQNKKQTSSPVQTAQGPGTIPAISSQPTAEKVKAPEILASTR